MKELKSYDLVDIQDYRGEVYIKSEADKYINLLKDKANYNEYAYKHKSEELSDTCRFYEDELRHNKYKRCLAMAMWCCDACDKWMMRKAKAIGLGKDGVKEYHKARRKLFHYMRWQTRWLKIAEKFKDKET